MLGAGVVANVARRSVAAADAGDDAAPATGTAASP
jgi:hypothetical protein